MKKIIYVVFIFFVPFFAINVQGQASEKKIAALNNYVDFINEGCVSLENFFIELENFNNNLNIYYWNRLKELEFCNRDSLLTLEEYTARVDAQYAVCLKDTVLPLSAREKLNSSTKKLFSLIKEIQIHRDSLAFYVKNKEYEHDAGLNTAYSILENCSELYTLYEEYKEELYSKIIEINALLSTSTTSKLAKSVKAFRPFLINSKLVIEGIKRGNESIVKSSGSQLAQIIEDLKTNKAKLLEGINIYAFDGNQNPYYLFDEILEKAISMYLFSIQYTKSTQYTAPYGDKGEDYFYYNYKLLKVYNNLSFGITNLYNEFLASTNETWLKTTCEPNWFKVLYPQLRKGEQKLVNNNRDSIITVPEVINNEPIALVEIKEEVIDAQPEVIADSENPKIKKDTSAFAGYALNNLVFLLDVSSSMEQPEKLPVLKGAFKHLVNLMRPEDYVAIVIYSGEAEVVVPATSAAEKNMLISSIEYLNSGGGTKVNKGLELSYEVALNNYITDGNNRIILATDGGFQIDKKFNKLVKKCNDSGISLTIIYLGKYENKSVVNTFRDITEKSNGNYIYVTSKNAKQVLLQEAKSIRVKDK